MFITEGDICTYFKKVIDNLKNIWASQPSANDRKNPVSAGPNNSTIVNGAKKSPPGCEICKGPHVNPRNKDCGSNMIISKNAWNGTPMAHSISVEVVTNMRKACWIFFTTLVKEKDKNIKLKNKE